MRTPRAGLSIAAVLILAACGSTTTAHVNHSPVLSGAPIPSAGGSPGTGLSSPPFPSASPGTIAGVQPVALSCTSTAAAGQKLALVTLRGVSGIVVRDITDINHPVSRCTFGGGSYFRFYSATRVSYIVMSSGDLGASGALYLADLPSRTTSLVRVWSNGGYGAWIYNWSPDGKELTYLSSDTSALQWHILSAAGDRVLLNLGPVVPRGANLDNDDTMVGFSADGQYVAVETTVTAGKAGTPAIAPVQVNRVSDGSVAYSRTDGTMAAWAGAGARFYFRTTAGVSYWSPTGGVVNVPGGGSWIHPIASPDGSYMAFSVLNAQQNHIGEVLNLTAGTTQGLSPNPRVGAAFLTASLVWYAGESICTTATPCGMGGPPLSGQTYIYDLSGNVETGSIDTAFFDSWPHVLGQS